MSDEHTNQINKDNEAFKQSKVFVQREEYFGIPSKVFYNVFALSVGLMVAFRSIYGVFVGLIMFFLLIVPLYHAHKKDPFALVVWKKCLFRGHNRWCAGRSEKRVVNILTKEEFRNE